MSYQIDTSIPGGNACDIQVLESEEMPEIRFASDPKGGTESLWFCFRIVGTGAGQIRLTWKHVNNTLGAPEPEGFSPVVRRAGQDWQRIGPGEAIELADGRRWATWIVDAPAGHMDVAFCFPYWLLELDRLVDETHGYWTLDTIGVSQGGRPLLRLSNAPGREGDVTPGLYLLARQHAGETPGSWVLDGFLRRIAHDRTGKLLVWAVPFADTDGVAEGAYGKDRFPQDLNRAWGQPPMRHEVLVYARDMERWASRCTPWLALDFHAPGSSERSGVYAFLSIGEADDQRKDILNLWAGRFAGALGAELAASSFGRIGNYPSRWNRADTYSRRGWDTGVECALSFETPYGFIGTQVLTRETYREIGSRLAGCVLANLPG